MLIAHRNGMAVWTNPYVTDGLVAMWDGEWNAGGGVHDASATTWKDLVRGTQCPFEGTSNDPTWTSNSFVSTSATQSVAGYFSVVLPSAGTDKSSTIEFVARKAQFGRGIVIGTYSISQPSGISSGVSMEWSAGNIADTGRVRAWWNGNPDLLSDADTFPYGTTLYSFSCTCDKALTYRVTKNGSNVLSEVVRTSVGVYLVPANARIGCDGRSYMGWNGEIYSIRIYNRALTAAEIAANYVVDKARFNLQ